MSATFSPCRTWRYSLSRDACGDAAGGSVVFVGLNPSTADERRDDPTIRRCIGFARRWGFGQLDVVNLYAFCSTDPRVLRVAADAVGLENDRVLRQVLFRADLVVCAWGNAADPRRAAEVLDWIGAPHCLGRTKHGSPRHPLYVRAATDPIPYTAP
jgi:hypothetical protein